MNPALLASPLVQSVLLAYHDASRGLRPLLKCLIAAERGRRMDEAHVLADNFVTAAVRAKDLLGTAERIARRLVARQPDRHHLENLSRVLSLRGKAKEAQVALRRSRGALDEHTSLEIRAAIEQAKALRKTSK